MTNLIKLVTEIGRRLEVDEARNPELQELKRNVAPEAVLERIQETGDSDASKR